MSPTRLSLQCIHSFNSTDKSASLTTRCIRHPSSIVSSPSSLPHLLPCHQPQPLPTSQPFSPLLAPKPQDKNNAIAHPAYRSSESTQKSAVQLYHSHTYPESLHDKTADAFQPRRLFPCSIDLKLKSQKRGQSIAYTATGIIIVIVIIGLSRQMNRRTNDNRTIVTTSVPVSEGRAGQEMPAALSSQ